MKRFLWTFNIMKLCKIDQANIDLIAFDYREKNVANALPDSYVLHTARLTLRQPALHDLTGIFTATRYPGFNDGMLWEPPESGEELEAPLRRAIDAWRTGEAFQFSIDTIESAEFVGRISIRQTDEAGVWNSGFWTHPEHQRQGYMTEALAAILKFGFTELDAIRIEACYAPWNTASQKVLARNGMQFLRYIEHGFKKRGEWVAENLYAITLEDWKHSTG